MPRRAFWAALWLLGVTGARLEDTPAALADEVAALPGGTPLPSRQFSGFLDDGQGGSIHYWFVESEGDAAADPVALWMNGGPGTSSLMGYMTELGPFVISFDGNLTYNPWSWAQGANLLFLEAPAGVGFSYCHGSLTAACSTTDDLTAKGNLQVLRHFFARFPKLSGRELMLWGESYAGIYVPLLAKQIVDAEPPLPVAFVGYAVGNACTADKYQLYAPQGMFMNGNPRYALAAGLIDDTIHETLNLPECIDRLPGEPEYCREAWRRFHLATAGFLSPDTVTPGLGDGAGFLDGFNMGTYVGSLQPYNNAFEAYLQREDVRLALHMENAPRWTFSSPRCVYHKQYQSCRDDAPGSDSDPAPQHGISMLPVHRELLARGLSVMIYSGDEDPNMQWRGSGLCARAVGLPEVEGEGWRPWFYREEPAPLDLMLAKAPEWGPLLSLNRRFDPVELGGFVQRFGSTSGGPSLTFATVRDVGHMVPMFRPQAALHLFSQALQAAVRSPGQGPNLSPPLPPTSVIAGATTVEFYGVRSSPSIIASWVAEARRMTHPQPRPGSVPAERASVAPAGLVALASAWEATWGGAPHAEALAAAACALATTSAVATMVRFAVARRAS